MASQIGSTQRNYLCIDNNCLDQKTEDYTLKIDPGQTSGVLQVALDAGLAAAHSFVKYTIINKSNPNEIYEVDLNFQIEESPEKENIYNSQYIILHDVYPNPVSDFASVDYTLLDDQHVSKIIIHNILGNVVEEYPLPASENTIKIHTDALNAGIYFYTLYLDNEGLVTRKLIVRK
jgi:hypothetical protein